MKGYGSCALIITISGVRQSRFYPLLIILILKNGKMLKKTNTHKNNNKKGEE
jgi:hypothetical protein